MKVNLNEIIQSVRDKLNSTNIILTGLEEDEKSISTILHGTGLVSHDPTVKDIVVYGSCTSGNKKIQQAKKSKIECFSLEDFKNQFLFEHDAKNALEGKTVLVDINLDYKAIMPIYLLNPKSVIWSNQINKRKVQEVDVIISNEANLDNIKEGLFGWLREREYSHLNLHGTIIEPQEKKCKKQFTH